MKNRNSGGNTDGRNEDGTFGPGNPGKPKGARNKATMAVHHLLEGKADALTNAVIGKALEGDATAMRLCIERIAPARKDSPVELHLPKIETATEAANAASAILAAVASGEVTPLEGATIMSLVEQFRRTLEVTEIERRILALEGKQ